MKKVIAIVITAASFTIFKIQTSDDIQITQAAIKASYREQQESSINLVNSSSYSENQSNSDNHNHNKNHQKINEQALKKSEESLKASDQNNLLLQEISNNFNNLIAEHNEIKKQVNEIYTLLTSLAKENNAVHDKTFNNS